MALCGACRVDAAVSVDVAAQGSGEVSVVARLDRAAVEAVGNLDRELRVDDLRRAGWVVAPVQRAGGGGAVLRASHRFSDPSQVGPLLADVAGRDGPFSGLSVRQRRSFFRTSTSFRGRVDLGRGLGSSGDPALTSSLRGSADAPLGVPDERLLEGRKASEVFGLDVVARLPGRDEVRWAPEVGGPPMSIDASAQQWNAANLAAVAVAVVAACLLAAMWLRYRG